MILCDAGVLLCLVDRTQPQHNPILIMSNDNARSYDIIAKNYSL